MMEIKTEQPAAQPAATILSLSGELDGSNFKAVIEAGRAAYAAGARWLLLDMGGVDFMGSAGLVAMHSLALIFAGRQPLDTEDGWGALRSIGADETRYNQVKIVGPQPSIRRSLESTGFDEILEVYAELDTALAACG